MGGSSRVNSRGYRHGTRNKFSKAYRTYRRGDYVDIVVDPSIQKGMPYSFYHGRSGVVFNVNRNAIGVEVNKVVGNRQMRKRLHIRLEHLRKSRCNEAFLKRVKENDKKKSDAKLLGKTINCKRVPEGPKPMKIVKAKQEDIEVLAPLPFVENYF